MLLRLRSQRVHPAQYILVGVAQIIFYLLLLSFAERIGFDMGFLIAGGSTVALLSLNAAWVFASRLQGLRALAVFSMLYTLIYLLLRLQDNALLVGAIASFLAVPPSCISPAASTGTAPMPSVETSLNPPREAVLRNPGCVLNPRDFRRNSTNNSGLDAFLGVQARFLPDSACQCGSSQVRVIRVTVTPPIWL